MEPKQTLRPVRLSVLLTLVLLAVCLTACKKKMTGTFVGRTELQTISYETGSFATSTLKSENVTATLTPGRTSSQFNLSFDEKSGLKCTFDVTNRNDEDSDSQNDDELTARIRNRDGETCEVRDKNGSVRAAKVIDASGGAAISEGAHTSFNIELGADESRTRYKFSFDGNRK